MTGSMHRSAWWLLVLLLALCHAARADDKADRVLGDWLTQQNKGVVRLFRNDAGLIDGRIVGGDHPDRVDSNNPDPAQRQTLLRGKVIARGFRFDGESYWTGGTIYDPNNGSTYKCRMRLNAEGQLEVRGYIGTPLLGRTAVWTRMKAPDQ